MVDDENNVTEEQESGKNEQKKPEQEESENIAHQLWQSALASECLEIDQRRESVNVYKRCNRIVNNVLKNNNASVTQKSKMNS